MCICMYAYIYIYIYTYLHQTLTWLHFFYIVSCQTKKKDEDKGNVIKGPMRLRKEEGLQMVVREGEQSTKTRTKEKKPNLSWKHSCSIVRVTMRLQRVTTNVDSVVAMPREVPMPSMTELQCHERLQIRVPKRSSKSGQNESERIQSYWTLGFSVPDND